MTEVLIIRRVVVFVVVEVAIADIRVVRPVGLPLPRADAQLGPQAVEIGRIFLVVPKIWAGPRTRLAAAKGPAARCFTSLGWLQGPVLATKIATPKYDDAPAGVTSAAWIFGDEFGQEFGYIAGDISSGTDATSGDPGWLDVAVGHIWDDVMCLRCRDHHITHLRREDVQVRGRQVFGLISQNQRRGGLPTGGEGRFVAEASEQQRPGNIRIADVGELQLKRP